MPRFAGRGGSDWVRLATQEVSGVSTLDFENEWLTGGISGATGQYFRRDIDIFKFVIIDFTPGTNHATLCFDINSDDSTGSGNPGANPNTGFDDSPWLTAACQFWNSDSTGGYMGYTPDSDLNQTTGPVYLGREVKAHTSNTGANAGGFLYFFCPHHPWRGITYSSEVASVSDNGAVHFESCGSQEGITVKTGALDGVRFSMTSGTFSGKFVLYGLGEGDRNVRN